MQIVDVVKKSAAYALINRDISQGRLSHAYLLSGEADISEALAKVFLSEAAGRESCADILRFPSGEKFKVDDVKDILDSAYITPTELERKFYVLSRTETMNEQAQNKLLKILEEPPRSVVFLLLCENEKAMLPTVLSRVKRVEIKPLTDEQVLKYLQDKYGDDNTVYLAAAMSRGYISRAEKIMNGRTLREVFSLALETLRFMKTSRNVLAYSAKIIKFKDNLTDFIDAIELILADCTAASLGRRAELRIKSHVRDVLEICEQYDADVNLRLCGAIRRARERIALNGNAQSVLDELLFSLLEVKARCRKSLE